MAVLANLTALIKANNVDFNTKFQQSARVARRSGSQISRSFRDMDQKGTTAFNRLRQAIVLVDGPLGGIGHRFNVMNSAIRGGGLAIAGVVAAMAGAILAFRQASRVAEQYERRFLKINAVLKATGQTSGLTGQQIREFSRQLALNTLASVEGVENAAAKLLTFRSIAGDTFKRTLTAAQDLAALGFGGIEMQVVTLGKALEDPITGLTALRRIGVDLGPVQEQMIKNFAETNRLAEAQGLILAGVEKQVAGAGAAEAGGLSGAFDTVAQRAEEFWLALDSVTGVSDNLTLSLTGLAGILRDLGGALNPNMFSALNDQLAAATGRAAEMQQGIAKLQRQIDIVERRGGRATPGEYQLLRDRNAALQKQAGIINDINSKIAERTMREAAAFSASQKHKIEQREQTEAAARAEAQRKAAAEARKEAERAAASERRDLERFAGRAIEDNKTKTEKLTDAIARLNKARKEGLLTEVEFQKAVKRTREEYAKMGASGKGAKDATDEVAKSAENMRQKFEDAFVDAVTGAGDFKTAFKKLVDDMVKQLARLVFRDLFGGPNGSAGIFGNIGSIFGGGGGGGGGGFFGGGGGGFLGSIFSGIGSIFGGFFADGGRPPLGKVSVVGEQGPELFVPDSAGTVVSHADIASAGAGGGPTFNVDLRGATEEAVARLERFVVQVNGSIERRAVDAVQDRFARSPNYLRGAKA